MKTVISLMILIVFSLAYADEVILWYIDSIGQEFESVHCSWEEEKHHAEESEFGTIYYPAMSMGTMCVRFDGNSLIDDLSEIGARMEAALGKSVLPFHCDAWAISDGVADNGCFVDLNSTSHIFILILYEQDEIELVFIILDKW